MARDKHLLQLRNNNIKKRFLKLQEDHPKWRFRALIDELESEFYLSGTTIERILNNH